MPEYKFVTTEGKLNKINSTEAKFGMTHEEFVLAAREFIENRESDFRRSSQGKKR